MKKFTYSFLALLALIMFACGGNKQSDNNQEAKAVYDAAFYESQPLHSGLYDAETYEMTGTTDKKGHFDGRIYFSLSPDLSAFYVFENGNRTKIDYLVTLNRPFEKTDSGTYYSSDAKENLPVIITPDTTLYYLQFQRGAENIKIGFSPKPRHEGTAVEIMEKMAAQRKK